MLTTHSELYCFAGDIGIISEALSAKITITLGTEMNTSINTEERKLDLIFKHLNCDNITNDA